MEEKNAEENFWWKNCRGYLDKKKQQESGKLFKVDPGKGAEDHVDWASAADK